jgi:hypothetical protein
MTMAKLTKPQLALLSDLATNGPEYVNGFYKPGQALLSLGYATARESVFGGVELTITEAGRRALNPDA